MLEVAMGEGELTGWRILVTRPEAQSQNLCRMIEDAGGIAVKCPALEIVKIPLNKQSKAVIRSLDACDWLIFTSRNAVNFTHSMFNGKIPLSDKVKIAAVGAATAECLTNHGINIDLLPESNYSSEALLQLQPLQDVKDKVVVIVRGTGGRELLFNSLQKRGATVKYLEVYKRIKPQIYPASIVEFVRNGQLDVITITSVESLLNLMQMLGAEIQPLLLALPLVVVSNRIKSKAVEMGFQCVGVTVKPSDKEIIKTVTALKNGEESGRIERK